MRCVLPVVSPTHNSTLRSVVFVNANLLASGLQRPRLNFGFGGRSTLISVPSGIFLRVRVLLNVVLCNPLVRGLILMPASRYIGCESSAIGGYRTARPCIAKVRVGLIVSA